MLESLLRTGETVDDLKRAFMERVEKRECGCWLWRGDPSCYGLFRGRPAHRASWEIFQGPIPGGLVVMHGCDIAGDAPRANPGCVNPAHLRPGTPSENAQDCTRSKLRQAELRLDGWFVSVCHDPFGAVAIELRLPRWLLTLCPKLSKPEGRRWMENWIIEGMTEKVVRSGRMPSRARTRLLFAMDEAEAAE